MNSLKLYAPEACWITTPEERKAICNGRETLSK